MAGFASPAPGRRVGHAHPRDVASEQRAARLREARRRTSTAKNRASPATSNVPSPVQLRPEQQLLSATGDLPSQVWPTTAATWPLQVPSRAAGQQPAYPSPTRRRCSDCGSVDVVQSTVPEDFGKLLCGSCGGECLSTQPAIRQRMQRSAPVAAWTRASMILSCLMQTCLCYVEI